MAPMPLGLAEEGRVVAPDTRKPGTSPKAHISRDSRTTRLVALEEVFA